MRGQMKFWGSRRVAEVFRCDLFIISIHGLKFMASPGLPEAGGPVSGLSPQVGGYFLGATGPLSGLLVPWRRTAGEPQAGRQPPRGQPTCRERPRSSHLRVGGQGGGLPTVDARGPQPFNVRAQSPVPRGGSHGSGALSHAGALSPGGWSQTT